MTVGGEEAIQLDLTLTRTGVDVTKRYVIFPSTSLIREQVIYKNTSASASTLARPSFLHQRMMGTDSAANDVDLTFMTGASARHDFHGSWTARVAPLTSTYRRDFDSYDQLACGSAALALSCARQDSYHETSATYIPWFDFHNVAREDGISFGLDLHGRWQASVGNVDSAPGGLSVTLPNYSGAVAPGESVTSPRAWMLTYAGDHDEMTNRLLEWQYRYLWDYTRADYFAGVRMLGYWQRGSQPPSYGDGYDPTGLIQKVFGLQDHMRHVGADGYHRDYGWWDRIGTWNGPDWRQSGDYLAKSGIRQTLYQPTYDANPDSAAYAANPSWFAQGVPCSDNDTFGLRLVDLSIPAAASWMQSTLLGNVAKWGDHAWRNDVCPIGNANGATQLKQSEALVSVSQAFLDANPRSSIQSVNSGGTEFGWELIRRSSSASFTDDRGDTALYDASRLFPVDKLSGMPDKWLVDECSSAFNFTLAFTPDYTGDSGDAAKLECLRGVIERYRYLKANGVAGRWIRYYHPSGTGVQRAWLQRVSRDGTKSVLLLGRAQSGAVTVYPKGLNAGDSYDVGFELGTGTAATRTGADLMSRGIALTSPPVGEIVWLGMPKRPGAGADRTAPTAPASVSAQYETNMNVPGVGLTWPAASDDSFLSGYDVLRDGARIAVVSKGTYYFDHSPAASLQSTYAVRAFDGDGNRGATVSTTPASADATVLDGTAGGISYGGSWSHQTGRVEAYGGTLSVASAAGATVTHEFTGSGISWYAQLSRTNGKAVVRIDGGAETVVDLWAPDDNNWRMPVFTRTWSSVARHRITITVLGEPHGDRTGTDVNVDGLQIRTTRPTVTEDDQFTYGGTGWRRPAGGQPGASSESATASGAGGEYDFTACRTACRGFSLTQGAGGWSYQDLRSGTWTNIVAKATSGSGYGRQWHDTTPSVGGWVLADMIHPGSDVDTARTWSAPRAGTIDISSRPAKMVAAGDGVIVKITKNGSTIAGPRTIAGSDRSGSDMNVGALTVAAGDLIRFEINRNGAYQSDMTNWDPEIAYRPASGCALACQLFSGQQGAGGWRNQGESGGTWSDLAGYAARSADPDGGGWSDGAASGPRKVYRKALRPGAAGAVARTWTAPRAGTVDLAGVPAKLETGGDGVVARITKNGTVVAGPRTIAAGDTTGSTLGATGVTVAAGDLIRFEVAAGATWTDDLTRWDPSVTYTGASCQLACQLFSDEQGSGNWRYQDQRNGAWGDIVSFLPTGFPTGPTWHDATPTIGGWVFEGVQHPGQSLDTARTWIAPVTGTVDIASRPFKFDTSAAGDGVVVKVTQNGRTVLGPRTIAATDGVGSAFDLERPRPSSPATRSASRSTATAPTPPTRRAGTRRSRTATTSPDSSRAYDPVTTATPSGPLFAEVAVTGRTVELIGRRCQSCGTADVYVDGVFDSRIDTYGFRGPDTWQAPVWKRSFATSARRTIRIVPTGNRSLDARAPFVFVDSVQASG